MDSVKEGFFKYDLLTPQNPLRHLLNAGSKVPLGLNGSIGFGARASESVFLTSTRPHHGIFRKCKVLKLLQYGKVQGIKRQKT